MDFYFRIQEVRQGNHEFKVNLANIAKKYLMKGIKREKKKGEVQRDLHFFLSHENTSNRHHL